MRYLSHLPPRKLKKFSLGVGGCPGGELETKTLSEQEMTTTGRTGIRNLVKRKREDSHDVRGSNEEEGEMHQQYYLRTPLRLGIHFTEKTSIVDLEGERVGILEVLG